MKPNRILRLCWTSLACLLAASLAPVAMAAAFGVTPIRVELAPNARTAIVNVTNDDVRKLHFRLKLQRWTQTPEGEDRLEDSSELVFFPQILVVEPKDKRIVRVGLKGPAPPGERSYRLFIEEMPDPADAAGGGAQIAVRLRFGVPIFVIGGQGQAAPEAVASEASKGQVRVAFRNGGDRSVRFEELQLVSGERVIAKSSGWYVFPGVTKWFTIPVDAAACPLSGPLEVRAVAEGKKFSRSLESVAGICPG